MKLALLGHPVAHSKSPAMQEAGLRALGLEGSYVAMDVPPGGLAATIRRLVDQGYDGWNVTVPYKEEIIPFVEVAGEEAQAAHSVNTVRNQRGRLLGYSTDGYGVAMALRRHFGFATPPPRECFLGTGGAARAAAVYAARHGAREITLFNRTPSHARALAERILAAAPQTVVRVFALADVHAAQEILAQSDICFQCTSLGLHADDPMPLPPECFPAGLPVYDFVYTPSDFKEGLAKRGCRVANGLEMLLQQGGRSLEIWTGRPAPLEAMRQALFS